MQTQKSSSTIAKTFTFFLYLVILFLKFRPLLFQPIGPGLDQSWRAALGYASDNKLVFGSDIVFSGGPLASVYTRQFVENPIFLVVFVLLSIVIFLSIAFSYLTVNINNNYILFFTLALLAFSNFTPIDGLFLFIPVLTALCFLKGGNLENGLLTAFGAALSAAIVLAKFSAFPISILTFATIDFLLISRRRWPLHVPVFVISLFCLEYLSGQGIRSIPAFVMGGIQFTEGYSSAMSLPGSSVETLFWLFLSSCFVLYVFFYQLRDEAIDKSIATIIIIMAFLFLAFKAGFVRHDLHTLISWNALFLAAIGVANTFKQRQRSLWLFPEASLVFAAVTLFSNYVLVFQATNSVPYQSPKRIIRDAMSDWRQFVVFVSAPSMWLDQQRSANIRALEVIKKNINLPPLVGSVDIIPSAQSALIANGLQYSPRPTIQEYATYSSPLIEKNRAFFSGSTSPKYILMAPGSIDGRYPNSAEGSLWPLFLSEYEPEDLSNNLAILVRRQTPVASIVGDTVRRRVSLGDVVAVPTGDAVELKTNIQLTAFGRLLDFLLRPPRIGMDVTFQDGSVQGYRLIPNMTNEGFVLSPLVETAEQYFLLSAGRLTASTSKVPQTIKIWTGSLGRLAYKESFELEFTKINTSSLGSDQARSRIADKIAEKLELLELLKKANVYDSNPLELVPEGILAHAPKSIVLPIQDKARITLEFGIRDGAWQGGNQTDGVCFKVSHNATELYQRCLDPLKEVEDRGPQKISLNMPSRSESLKLETTCHNDCRWDWSYWNVDAIH